MILIITICLISIIFRDVDCRIDDDSDKSKKLEREFETSRFSSCFEELGCIDTTDEWYHNIYRPVNMEPLDRHTIRTEFILITKTDSLAKPLHYETLSVRKDLLKVENYKLNQGLIMLIHDFTSNGYTGWVKHIGTALFSRKELNFNVISVDWEAGAEPPFKQAIANARIVALEIKLFIGMIKESMNDTSPGGKKDFCIHIIGHGVGAHIAGYVGGYVTVGRITGLDPTGPSFENMPPIVRLDPGDARYVEVLHTDAFNHRSQGAKNSLGHVDFFLNGAKLQPQCNQSSQFPIFTDLDRNTLKEGEILPACSHKRAFKYYIEALDSDDCEFTGFSCDSYEDFNEGKCTSCNNGGNMSKCATFGLLTPSSFTANNFYLNTNGEPPFCINPYKVEIYIEKGSKTKNPQKGYFELLMLDEDGLMTNAIPSSMSTSHLFEAGKSYTFIFYASSPRINKIVEGRLKWTHNPNSLCVVFCTTSIHVNRIVIHLLTTDKANKFVESHLCPKKGKAEIENGSYGVFTRCSENAKGGGATSSGCGNSTAKP